MSIQSTDSPLVMTAAEYLETGETDHGYSELVDGRYVMSPGPRPKHYRAARRLTDILTPVVPAEYEVLLDIDLDLHLAPSDGPGTVRRPDVMVVRRSASQAVDRDGGFLSARDALLVVEIVSPSSVRTDYVHKRGDYCDAGIPHYWIVDTTEPVSLLACHQAGDFGYADGGVVTGRFSVTTPFPVEIDLDALA